MVLYDFHTHTFHSDGVLSPIDLIRRALLRGYSAIAITDQVALGSLGRAIHGINADCALARAYWNILAMPGVELTHFLHRPSLRQLEKPKKWELGL
jgi:putative hydrolase